MKSKLKLFLGVIFISFLTSNITYAQSGTDCKVIHSGDFTYGSFDDLVQVNIKGKRHIEYHDDGKYYIKSKLEWISDCEYNMTMRKITIPNFPYGKGDVMNVKIRRVEGSKIYYTSTVNGQSWNGVFTKVE